LSTQVTEAQEELLQLLEHKERELQYNKIKSMFPNTGPYRRELYVPHIKFITASAHHGQLAFIGANRTGKTKCGAYIMATHLTGDYPSWWEGKKYLNAIDAWAAGKTNQKTKEIIQFELLGPENDIGSGMIPKEAILKITKKPGVADAIETVTVRHKSGGVSNITFKSYEQGRDGFEGTKKQVIWLDEEPADASIYSECLMRTADQYKPGIIYCTFTPLYGLSDVVMQFLPDGKATVDGRVPGNADRFSIQATWDDVPHLSESDKSRLWAGCLPHEREARSKGIPSLGAGAIYPYLEDNITCAPFEIPSYWKKAYGMDSGWSRTAAVWGAQDPDTKIVYLYSEHYLAEAHPAIHASAIKARGSWIWGAADPAGANISDGKKIFDMYVEEGLNIVKASKGDREGGILAVSQMFATGMVRIFSTLTNTLAELRVYRRDEKGEIIKKKDHAMDAMRYLLTTGIEYMSTPDDPDSPRDSAFSGSQDSYTGY
jgi:phage terminase large subunit-like protein